MMEATKTECIKYKKLCVGSLRLYCDGRISRSEYRVRKRAVQNRMALALPYSTPDEYIPLSKLRCSWSVYHQQAMSTRAQRETVSLYVYPEVGTSRDIIRKSGYKIVLDPSKADYCVAPAFAGRICDYRYDILAYDDSDESLYLYTVTNYMDEIPIQNLFDRAKQDLTDCGLRVIGDRMQVSRPCIIVQKSDAFIDILRPTDDTRGRKYISELQLPLDYGNEISIQNLLLWKQLAETNNSIFEKVIVNTDWRDYPVTMCFFLSLDCPMGRIFYSSNSNTKMMLTAIGFDRCRPAVAMCEGRVVEPKDWNMLQDYIMASYDVEPQGGFITDRKACTPESDWLNIVRRRLCIAPLKIDSPVLFDNLISCL